MANTGLGEAIGLQGKPDNYFFALGQLGQQEKARKAAEEAAKKKKDQDDLNKMFDEFKVDPTKYHYKDRPKAYQNAAETFDKAWDIYKNDPVNWRNKISRLIYDARFTDAQIQQDSTDKFNNEKLFANNEIAKSPSVTKYFGWLHDGKTDTPPPELEVIPGGQVVKYNPQTANIVFKPVKNVNMSDFVQKSIFEPAETGKITTQASVDKPLSLPTGEKVYQRQMGYAPDVIEANIAASVGSPMYEYWVATNEDRLREALKANPDVEPGKLYYDMYSQDIKNMQPKQVEEYTEEEAKANVTNIYNEPEAKNQTRWGDVSNVMTGFIQSSDPLTYTGLAKTQGGNIVYRDPDKKQDPFGVSITVPVKLAEKVVTIPQGRAYDANGNVVNKSGQMQGRISSITLKYGFQDTDGNIEQVSQAEIDKLTPEQRSKLIPYSSMGLMEEIPAFKKDTEGQIAKDEWLEERKAQGLTDKPQTVFMKFNLSQGSPDADDLNAIAPNLFITARGKTEQSTGKAGNFEASPKKQGIPTTEKKNTSTNTTGGAAGWNQYKR